LIVGTEDHWSELIVPENCGLGSVKTDEETVARGVSGGGVVEGHVTCTAVTDAEIQFGSWAGCSHTDVSSAQNAEEFGASLGGNPESGGGAGVNLHSDKFVYISRFVIRDHEIIDAIGADLFVITIEQTNLGSGVFAQVYF